MAREKKSHLYIGEVTYGKRKIEDVFKEVYEHYLGVKVTVRRKTKQELEEMKRQKKKD